jgi:hypothetical protein
MPPSLSVSARAQVVLDTLREHPWSTSRMLYQTIMDETGGAPTMLTGALWIPPWKVYADLCQLERRGKVERRTITRRNILWRALDA